jgi:hypothetical protein
VKCTKRRDDGGEEHPPRMSFSIASGDDGKPRLVTDGSARPTDRPVHERIFELLCREGGKLKIEMRNALGLSGGAIERGLTVLFKERRCTKRKKLVKGRERDCFFARQDDAALDGIIRKPARGQHAP